MNIRQFILAAIIPAAIISISMPAAAKGFEHMQQQPMQQQQMQQQQYQQQMPDRFEQRHKRDRGHHFTRFIRVHRGDTLSNLARRYHTTVYSLKRLNHLHSNTIYVGQRLRVH